MFSSKFGDPDDWYYCGKDPAKPVPSIPPLNTTKNLSLLQVEVLFRHGDRTPFSWYSTPGLYGRKQCWPNDTASWTCDVNYLNYPSPNNNVDSLPSTGVLFRKVYDSGTNVEAGNCDVGQLTQKGFFQEITNGKMLRNYYVDQLGFLPTSLTEADMNVIHVRSDDEPRTVLSAQGVILGLFPPSNNSQNLIIDIHTRSAPLAVMETNPTLCPRLGQIHEEAVASPEWVAFWNKVATPLAQKISSILGVPFTPDNLEDFNDCSNGHYCHGFPLYPGMDLSLIQAMERVSLFGENYLNSYPNVTYNAKRGIGFLINEMYQGLAAKLADPEDASVPSILLFSGHDTTIMPWLTAYGLPPSEWVGYASTLLVELYQDNDGGDNMVRVIYNQQELTIPGCGGVLCDWETFSNITQSLVSTDYVADCAPL